MNNVDYLESIAQNDVKIIKEKDKEYGSSWKKRGGIGAFHMLARKWDRLEVAVTKQYGDDIFLAIREDERPEGILDDIRDLRRYLMLVESEIILSSGSVPEYGSIDNDPWIGGEGCPEVMRDSDYDNPMEQEARKNEMGYKEWKGIDRKSKKENK